MSETPSRFDLARGSGAASPIIEAARRFSALRNPEQAKEVLRDALAATAPDQVVERLLLMNAMADDLERRGLYGRSEPIWRDIHAIAVQHLDAGSVWEAAATLHRANALNHMATPASHRAAIDLLEGWLARLPANSPLVGDRRIWLLLRVIGWAHEALSRPDDAREAWRTARLAVKAYGRCRNRDPKNLSALYSVLTQREVVLVPTESTVQIALANVKMAVRAQGRAGPEAAHAVSLLAQVYRQVGALDRASFWLKRALRLYRAIGDPLFVDVLRDALGDSLLAQGRRVEAAGV